MKTLFTLLFFILFFLNLNGQSILSGSIQTKKGEPVAGANIYIKNTFEGTSSDSAGQFLLQTKLSGNQILVVSFLGYTNNEQNIALANDTINFSIILIEDKTSLDEVVISAGSFEAGDEKKSAVLNTLDMATNAQGFGDIFMSINALPGTSTADDEGGLLVRGGERYETKTFIDGLLVESPYTAKMSNVPVRGKFSPMLFRGTVFSTGGYTAEFGQALSSALILNSIAFPKEDETNIALYTSAANLTKIKKWRNTSLSSITQYMNIEPFYKIAGSNFNWEKAPESFSETLVFRKKISKTGLLKAMGFITADNSSLFYPNMDTETDDLINLKNRNYFFLSSYKTEIGKSILHTGMSFNRDRINMKINNDSNNDLNQSSQLKLTISKIPSEKFSIKLGGDIYYKRFSRSYRDFKSSSIYKWDFETFNTSLFAESYIRVGNKIAVRPGIRFEHLGLINKAKFSPRFSAAYQINSASQFSLAYGQFTQLPEDNNLLYNTGLQPEQATHFILNYQVIKNNRTFRFETYYKDYSNLVKYDSLYAIMPGAYSNTGTGYAQGIDVFFRDRQTIRNGDFWLAYSFIDSKRNYRDFEFNRTPGFVTRHNLSVQYKHYFEKLDAYLTSNYNFASGRPYMDPNFGNKMFETKQYHNLSSGFFYFTEWFGKFTMLHVQVTNLLGFNHVFGYQFATNPDITGRYRAYPVLPSSKRMILFGIYICLQNKTEF